MSENQQTSRDGSQHVPPVNETQYSLFVINHDVVWLDISVHDAVGMAIVKSFEQLKDVVPNIKVGQGGIEYLKVSIVHMFKD